MVINIKTQKYSLNNNKKLIYDRKLFDKKEKKKISMYPDQWM